MGSGPSSQVFFPKSKGLDLAGFKEALLDRGLTVRDCADHLKVSWMGPTLSIHYDEGPFVLEENIELLTYFPKFQLLAQCDAMISISFENMDEVLDEINTLIEVQCTIQDKCNGILFNPWNGSIFHPDYGDETMSYTEQRD